jgi:aminoglycoside/choline kinase family phosphotransferase
LPTNSLHRLNIPETPDQVDAAWLTGALSRNYPGLVVEEAEILNSLGGACTKLRVALRTNWPDFPRSVIVKGCFEPHTRAMMPLQLREAYAYERVVPRLSGIHSIRALFVGQAEGARAALILEDLDLRGVHCLRALEPIDDFELAGRFIDALARLHSHWWNSPEISDGGAFNWIPRLNSPMLLPAYTLLADPAQTADMMRRPRGAAIPRLLHNAERLRRAFGAMIDRGHVEPMVLGHGDPHLSNLFVDAEGNAGLLDWTCFRAPWALDVTYFIAGCLDVADRRRWEAALLARYLDRLTSLGVTTPALDDAWCSYRCWHFWGLLVWLVNTTDYHTEAQITAMATRFAWAVIDHDSFNLLDAQRPRGEGV